VGKRDYDRVKQEIKAAGCAGERTVLMVPTDSPRLKVFGDVAADMMHRVGLNVDYAATDFGAMLHRRNNKSPVEQGGWSAFVTGGPGWDWMNPAGHIAMRGNGDQPGALAGWYVGPRVEALRNSWFAATTLADQQKICADIQQQCLIDVPFYSLGQLLVPTAYRADLTGMLNGFATFWNIRRTA
jgi:peptide/nickel transport system substrate-binding protein